MNITANTYLCCSKEAGEWLFRKKDYVVINNAIEIEKFKYNNEIRNKYRKQNGIKDEVVIGHKGCLNKQKNQEFLLEVFNEIHKNNKKTKLMLVGAGALFDTINNKVRELKLEDDVLLLGSRSDANNFYQAMDIFVFPSIYEGLGISLVEAQTSGLKCFASDRVPREVDVTGTVEFYSLNLAKEVWAEKIIEKMDFTRYDNYKIMKNSNFNIKNEAKKLEDIYLL